MTIPDRNPTSDEVLEWFRAQQAQKLDWLSKFSSGKNKWPENEIDRKRYDLWILNRLESVQAASINARKSA